MYNFIQLKWISTGGGGRLHLFCRAISDTGPRLGFGSVCGDKTLSTIRFHTYLKTSRWNQKLKKHCELSPLPITWFGSQRVCELDPSSNSTGRRRERQCRFLFAKWTPCFVVIEISREFTVLGFWVRRRVYYLTDKSRTLDRASRTFRRGNIKTKNAAISTHVIYRDRRMFPPRPPANADNRGSDDRCRSRATGTYRLIKEN